MTDKQIIAAIKAYAAVTLQARDLYGFEIIQKAEVVFRHIIDLCNLSRRPTIVTPLHEPLVWNPDYVDSLIAAINDRVENHGRILIATHKPI